MSPDPLAVLVTGAAGGVGRAVVAALAEAGMRISAVDLSSSDLHELAVEVVHLPAARPPYTPDPLVV